MADMKAQSTFRPRARVRECWCRIGLLLIVAGFLVSTILAAPVSAASGSPCSAMEKALAAQADARDGTLAPLYSLQTVNKALPPESAETLTSQACSVQPRGPFPGHENRSWTETCQGCHALFYPPSHNASHAPWFCATGADPGSSPGFVPRC
jgi:hypothetical protein